jgi:hypothetical protein
MCALPMTHPGRDCDEAAYGRKRRQYQASARQAGVEGSA